MQNRARKARITATLVATLSCSLLFQPALSEKSILRTTAISALAQSVPAKAVAYYNAGLAAKGHNNALALKDFAKAAAQAKNWESPVYQEGIILSSGNFPKAIRYLLKAAAINPKDDTVWNILGWGYYSEHAYSQAEAAFTKQLHVNPQAAPGWWGLANVYMNSQVRHFASAKVALLHLLKDSTYGSRAKAALAKLPPSEADATFQPNTIATEQDVVVLMLSYRNIEPVTISSYVSWAKSHHVLDGLIYQAKAPATRLFMAHVLANYYGVDRFEYLRPFPYADTTSLSTDDQMLIQTMVANQLLQPISKTDFGPDKTMSRSAFASIVANANQVLATGKLNPATWLTPPTPPTQSPFVYFFNNNAPDHLTQLQDAISHSSQLSAVGLTEYPWASVFPKGAATTRLAIDGTTDLLTPMSAGVAQTTELQGLIAHNIPSFLVLGNYNNLTNTSDPKLADELLNNPSEQATLLQDIVKIMTSEQLTGITVDFENLYGTDRGAYTKFVQLIGQTAASHHWKMMICLPERDGDDASSAYDWRALAAASDYAMLITYDEHTLNGKPGPISNFANTTRVIQYAALQMDPSKILVGVADYGYDWGPKASTEVSMDGAVALSKQYHAQIQWDAASQTPFMTYTDAQGGKHSVWFENQASIAAIVGAVHRYGLKGIAVWHLGYENAGFWNALQQ